MTMKWVYLAIMVVAIIGASSAYAIHLIQSNQTQGPSLISPSNGTTIYRSWIANPGGPMATARGPPGPPFTASSDLAILNATEGSMAPSNGTIITVSGEGSIDLQPEGITIYITISNQQPLPTPSQAYDYMESNVNEFISTLNSLGVNYTTTEVSLNPVYEYYNGAQQLEGYSASYGMKITLMNPISQTLVGELLSNASSDGASSISISTYISPYSYQQGEIEAMKAAVQIAMSKIYGIASALGLSSIKIISVQESAVPTYYPAPYPIYATALNTGPSLPINPGSASITATVTITAIAN
ncbi:hypothetical protein GCM10007981_15500 [Thermocladium modestius]|uniref:DUF541 domain-containing protein n=1 Tax=Thermocladium modestius TaxID=62609 RepID=A0A830GW00_9CREN|nr:SIMPL domain-containing protein [Thermocladium modestius]GGP21882.1 hypothetical protein GCM10007981_15500 [Thermocladium modestius]